MAHDEIECEDIYVLIDERDKGIVMIADDFEWLNMKTADYSAEDQLHMIIKNHDLLRVSED